MNSFKAEPRGWRVSACRGPADQRGCGTRDPWGLNREFDLSSAKAAQWGTPYIDLSPQMQES